MFKRSYYMMAFMVDTSGPETDTRDMPVVSQHFRVVEAPFWKSPLKVQAEFKAWCQEKCTFVGNVEFMLIQMTRV